MTAESAFRAELQLAADAGDWSHFHATRLVFSDFLEERGRVDEATANRMDLASVAVDTRMTSGGIDGIPTILHGLRCPLAHYLYDDGKFQPRSKPTYFYEGSAFRLLLPPRSVCWRQWRDSSPIFPGMVLTEPWLHFAPRSVIVASVGPALERDYAILLHRAKGRLFEDMEGLSEGGKRFRYVYPPLTLRHLALAAQGKREEVHA